MLAPERRWVALEVPSTEWTVKSARRPVASTSGSAIRTGTGPLRRFRQAGRAEPTGDLRTDLRAIAASLHDGFLQHNYLGLLGTALVERDHHPEILEGYRERLMNPRRSSIREVIERAVREGQLKSDVDIELGVAMLVGAFYSLTLSKERPESPSWIDRVTDGVIGALLGSTQPSEQQSREA